MKNFINVERKHPDLSTYAAGTIIRSSEGWTYILIARYLDGKLSAVRLDDGTTHAALDINRPEVMSTGTTLSLKIG